MLLLNMHPHPRPMNQFFGLTFEVSHHGRLRVAVDLSRFVISIPSSIFTLALLASSQHCFLIGYREIGCMEKLE